MEFECLGAEETRDRDRRATAEFGIPGLLLMENAGRGAAELAESLAASGLRDGFWVLAGPGNNGGDAYVAARHLANRGHAVVVSRLAGREGYAKAPDAALNLGILERWGVALHDDRDTSVGQRRAALPFRRPLLVDGLLGTGLRGAVRAPIADWIRDLRALELPALSLDLPSGLDADDGSVHGVALPALATATFGAPKPGLLLGEGPALAGQTAVIDISWPPALRPARRP
ncbi:MAG: NAD(P)H-hydrate epimerase [Planctomycetota bacterium]